MCQIIEKLLNSDDNMRKQIAVTLAAMGAEGTDIILKRLETGKDERALLLTLSRMVKSAKCMNELINRWRAENYKPLINFSRHEDAKVRKSAYIIMGKIQDKRIQDALIRRLDEEKTLFVVPSILLALGNFKGDAVKERINKFIEEIRAPKDNEKKHIDEIITSANKALDKLSEYKTHTFKGLTAPVSVLIVPNPKQIELTFTEAKEYFDKVLLYDNEIRIITADYQKIYNIRTFSEALISPERLRNIPPDAGLIADRIADELPGLLNQTHIGAPPYRYRIEIKGDVRRRQLIDEIIKTLNGVKGNEIVNSLSNYELEIRIRLKGSLCDVYYKLLTFNDERFSYRIKALPASIKGETAAVCMRLIKPYLRDNARVLDPFAGTGTMLIERAKLSKNLSLTGVDIYAEALKHMKVNTIAAGVKADMIKSDILDYNPSGKFDEIISNMPYGIRVSTHKENETLYRNFINRLPGLIHPSGIIALLTADFSLLKSVCKGKLKLISEHPVDTGGLTPRLLIFRCP